MLETSNNSSSTSSTSSSSAAAVTDSANALANSKSPTVAMGAPATSVKLLIKSSNQQFEDQTIECDLQWSVKRLKTQLSLVYPSKPAVCDQKLIYSGQLLNDTLLLKDVIRSYKDVHTQNHIFHIVCAAKPHQSMNASKHSLPKTKASSIDTNARSSATAFASDGLRYRQNAVNESQQQQPQQQQQQQSLNSSNNSSSIFNAQLFPQLMAAANGATHVPQCPNFNGNNNSSSSAAGAPPNMFPFSFPAQFNMQSMAVQQAAMYNWMQQVYSQYMDQCIRLSNNSASGLPTMSPTDSPASNMPPLNAAQFGVSPPFFQQMPVMPNVAPMGNFGAFAAAPGGVANPMFPLPNAGTSEATMAAAAATQQQHSATPAAAIAAEQPVAAAAGAGAAAAAAARDPQALQQQLPRFPNLVQDDQEHNDWLDNFFSLTRMAIFLTLIFFNTSPLRCLLVVIIAGGIYLYHIGVFRLRGEHNNNNMNRDNNAANAANQIRQGVQEVQQAQAQQQQQQQEQQPAENQAAAAPPAEPLINAARNATESSQAPAAAATAAAENQVSTSAISFIRTFVVSFFTSLLPETPAQ